MHQLVSVFFIEITWKWKVCKYEGYTMTTGGHLSSCAGYWHSAKKGWQQFSRRPFLVNNDAAALTAFFLFVLFFIHIFHVKP